MTLTQIIGSALILLFLADVFLTLLYARAGTGLLAPHWNRAVWAMFCAVARRFGEPRGAILSYAGPLIVVSLIGLWALGLTVGVALVIWPELGGAVRSSSGETSTDFSTALFVAGSSLSIVGGGSDYGPHTAGTRVLFLVNSLIGASVLSLVVSCLVQVYSAFRERNALAHTVDLLTDGTGDAAMLLARLGPDGNFSDATSQLSNLARSLAAIKEAHHFYPLLFYFRLRKPLYSIPRVTFILLDLITLVDTALDRDKYGVFVRSSAVRSVRRCALLLLDTLDLNLSGSVGHAAPPLRSGHAAFTAATETLRHAGIEPRAGGDDYADQRAEWEPLVRRVAASLCEPFEDVDRRHSTDETTTAERSAVGSRPRRSPTLLNETGRIAKEGRRDERRFH